MLSLLRSSKNDFWQLRLQMKALQSNTAAKMETVHKISRVSEMNKPPPERIPAIREYSGMMPSHSIAEHRNGQRCKLPETRSLRKAVIESATILYKEKVPLKKISRLMRLPPLNRPVKQCPTIKILKLPRIKI